MYNITETDVEFEQLLKTKIVEFEKQFENNLIIQESTMELLYKGVMHSDLNEFKNNRLVWNASCYVNIISYDLKVIGKNLMLSKTEWEKRYFARQAGLLIYEGTNDLFDLFGREFRTAISGLSDFEKLKESLKQITKRLNLYKETHVVRLHNIRNVSIAHRDQNTVEQLSTIFSISWVEAINFVSEFDQILNLTGQFLQEIMNKSVVEFPELNGK
jgi:hypothetical protein